MANKIENLKKQLKIRPIKDRRLRIIFNGNAPWANSGYSVELRDLILRLANDGWPIAWICSPGLSAGSSIPWSQNPNVILYPHMQDVYGSDGIYHHSKHFRADVIVTMQDLGTIDPNILKQLAHEKRIWIPYFPIDQEPIPPQVIERMQYAYRLITFSKFGYQAIQKRGFTSTLILEGTDCNIFQPRDKKEIRTQLGWPQDKFIFGMIGANKENPPRKGWPQGIEAFKKFSDIHPEALLYVHCNQLMSTGFPIWEYADHLGIKNKLFAMDHYTVVFHSDSNMISKLINGLDCLLEPSMTEGFCLPIIEAQASGIPVIANNCHSMPELIIDGVTSEICETKDKMFSPQLGYIYFADPDSLNQKMEKVFQNTPEFYAKAAREWVLNNFNIDTLVKDKWIPFFEELQQELLGPLPNTLQEKLNVVQSNQLNKTP